MEAAWKYFRRPESKALVGLGNAQRVVARFEPSQPHNLNETEEGEKWSEPGSPGLFRAGGSAESLA